MLQHVLAYCYWVMHNLVAHPLMVFWPKQGKRFHQWTHLQLLKNDPDIQYSELWGDDASSTCKVCGGSGVEVKSKS